MNAPIIVSDAEFTDFVAKHGMIDALRKRNRMRLAIGCLGFAGVLAFNLYRSVSDFDVLEPWLGLGCLGFFVIAVVLAVQLRRRFVARLRRPALGLRDEVARVARYLDHDGEVLLMITYAGHALATITSFLGIPFFAAGTQALTFLLLAPTFILIVRGIRLRPTLPVLLQARAALRPPP